MSDNLDGLRQLVNYYFNEPKIENYTIEIFQRPTANWTDEDWAYENRLKYKETFTGTYEQAENRREELIKIVANEQRFFIGQLYGGDIKLA